LLILLASFTNSLLLHHRICCSPSACTYRLEDTLVDEGRSHFFFQFKQREAWQQLLPIKLSQAEVASFCLELSKKMDMRYKSPPLPVNLAMTPPEGTRGNIEGVATDTLPVDTDAVAALFDRKQRETR